MAIGDADAAIAAADSIVEAEYRVPYLSHAPMEPMNCTAWLHDGICEFWTGTQNPLGFAAEVAERWRWISPTFIFTTATWVADSAGARFPTTRFRPRRIAAEVSYPVQLIWSREEDMRHDHYRQASISRFKAALDSNGKPTAWVNQYVEKHDPKEAPYIPVWHRQPIHSLCRVGDPRTLGILAQRRSFPACIFHGVVYR